MDIIFRDPPEANRKGRPSQVINFLKCLEDSRGVWAVYREGMGRDQAHALASQNRRRHKNSEWTARPNSVDGSYSVYVRLISD